MTYKSCPTCGNKIINRNYSEFFDWPENRPLEKAESQWLKDGMQCFLQQVERVFLIDEDDKRFQAAMLLFRCGLEILYDVLPLMEERGRGK